MVQVVCVSVSPEGVSLLRNRFRQGLQPSLGSPAVALGPSDRGMAEVSSETVVTAVHSKLEMVSGLCPSLPLPSLSLSLFLSLLLLPSLLPSLAFLDFTF